MYSSYTYAKCRREYGRQCKFNNWGPKLLENLIPEPGLEEQWIAKNPCHRSTLIAVDMSLHDINTIRAEYAERGINHVEGGWPKDVNIDDPEQVVRFRKKAEKDESYMQAVIQMSNLTEHFIHQNNSIDIYEPYFIDPDCQLLHTIAPSFRTVAIMSDTFASTRPVQNISWSPDQGSLVAISYANLEFQKADPLDSPNSLIFDLEDSTTPYLTIESQYPVAVLEFNNRDSQCLAGGLVSGQVCYWDIRKSSASVGISNVKSSHRDPVRSLRWIHSKTSTEFYTGAADGQVMWWDTRKLTEPTEVLFLDLSKSEKTDDPEWEKWARSHGVSCLDYDPAIPIRFMIGTETGQVFNGNRKGKTVFEKISGIYNCHAGPVYAAQRSPTFLKNFLTVGDWQVRLWSEDVKDSPIMWSKRHEMRLTDGAWSETKPSVFYTIRADGCLDAWDVLQKQKDPILTIKVSDKSLNCIKCHENGALLAVGDDCGKTYVIEMNDWFVTPGKNDKALMAAMFDRETKREKIIEAKHREMKLKAKTGPKETTGKDNQAKMAEAVARLIEQAEREFIELSTDKQQDDATKEEDQVDEVEEEAGFEDQFEL
ncbi:dynein intermediate chain 3, ciliary-like [Adelges cooleyi]|uniref:dynein intermediate chain 3, ciliary-like n=1 Tax=Adelges cooleyi TaxID=133065 RepID=UPI0021808166|nr:dynein intermediate chain 3, ciliary-like [Adelges cooleyi]